MELIGTLYSQGQIYNLLIDTIKFSMALCLHFTYALSLKTIINVFFYDFRVYKSTPDTHVVEDNSSGLKVLVTKSNFPDTGSFLFL